VDRGRGGPKLPDLAATVAAVPKARMVPFDVDAGRDDYYQAAVAGCLDLSDSAYLQRWRWRSG
jgi:hypothetical protein